jgi:hypothetical protein
MDVEEEELTIQHREYGSQKDFGSQVQKREF